MALSTVDHTRIEHLKEQADECRARAEEAIEKGSPVGAREWLEAEAAALRNIQLIKGGA